MPPLIYIREIDSTNNYLKSLLLHQAVEEGTVVYADYQQAGRGQRNTVWESEAGANLLFSMVLFPTSIKANEQFVISQLVSLAIKNVLDQYTDSVTIKWPNDIYHRNKKIGGILIENSLSGSIIDYSILGVGLNINQEYFSERLPNPISLRNIIGKETDTMAILTQVQENIRSLYQSLSVADNRIVQPYKESLYRLQGYHLYNDGLTNFLARIVDVTPSGILVLQTQGGEKKHFSFKEITYR